jgi:methylenetetrahydrofolate--tRNA-(uracil-5-)-methyltransferase
MAGYQPQTAEPGEAGIYPPDASIVVVGAGLAGSEAAWQAARRGPQVILYEMRPAQMTPAHQTDHFAELVCSNSMGSDQPDRALGLLKNELRQAGSLIIACADATALPAGRALAVDREAFSRAVTTAIQDHPGIEVRREEVRTIPEGVPTVIATGPLTSRPLADAIRSRAGQDYLQFFDAMAPIVTAESINMTVAFRASRYAKETEGDGDYINCPLTRDQYYAFVEAVKAARKIPLHEFEREEGAERFFEACLPIEVLAARDPDALAFGPLRPTGLRDPRTGFRPFAVVQLRQDNAAGSLYNLVGFQTNIVWTDQERVLRTIPGLEGAEIVRFGQMHRNTFINSPVLLRPTLQWRDRDDLFFAGQITGTEGYVGSTAGGLLAGINAARMVKGLPALVLPPTAMMGALFQYITHASPDGFQPMKANFGLLPELDSPMRNKRKRHAAYVARALTDLEGAMAEEVRDYPVSFARDSRLDD